MKKSKEICWFLQIKETKNLRFCQEYLNTNELSLENNKRIIDKFADDDIKRICWVGDEAINYPHFIKLLEYAKEKEMECELVFNDVSRYDLSKFKDILKHIDKITLTMNFIDSLKDELSNYFNTLKYFPRDNINVLTIVNANIFNNKRELLRNIEIIGVKNWTMLSFMPILLKETDNIDILKLPKIRYREFSSSCIFYNNLIDHIYRCTEYTISRRLRIILPNGDIAIINEKDSMLIGNVLKDEKERIEKNFNNKRKYIIPRKRDEKIKIIIASNNKKTIKNIIDEMKLLKYVDIIGILKSGNEAYKEIVEKKPDMIFLHCDFNDIPGLELILKISHQLKLEAPTVNVLGKDLSDYEIRQLVYDQYTMLNVGLGKFYYKGEYTNIVEQYKEYRDKDL